MPTTILNNIGTYLTSFMNPATERSRAPEIHVPQAEINATNHEIFAITAFSADEQGYFSDTNNRVKRNLNYFESRAGIAALSHSGYQSTVMASLLRSIRKGSGTEEVGNQQQDISILRRLGILLSSISSTRQAFDSQTTDQAEFLASADLSSITASPLLQNCLRAVPEWVAKAPEGDVRGGWHLWHQAAGMLSADIFKLPPNVPAARQVLPTTAAEAAASLQSREQGLAALLAEQLANSDNDSKGLLLAQAFQTSQMAEVSAPELDTSTLVWQPRTGQQSEQLNALVAAISAYRVILPPQPGKMAEYLARRDEMAAVKQEFGASAGMDEDTLSQLNMQLTDHAIDLTDFRKAQASAELIATYHIGMKEHARELLQIWKHQPTEFQNLLKSVHDQRLTHARANASLSGMVSLAKLDQDEAYKTFNLAFDPEEGDYQLNDQGDPRVRYTAFILMRDAGLISKSALCRPGKPYRITAAELAKISTHIDTAAEEIANFWQVVDMLGLGDYVLAGKKTASEAVAIDDENETLSMEMRAALQRLGSNMEVLLPNSTSLDITSHPDRVRIRKILEDVYASLGLKSIDGKKKTFITEARNPQVSTFRSNIGRGHIQEVSRILGMLALPKKRADDIFPGQFFQENGEDQIMVEDDRFDPVVGYLSTFKEAAMRELEKRVVGSGQYLELSENEIRGMTSDNIATALRRVESSSRDNTAFLLNSHTSISFKQRTQAITPGDNDIAFLYGQNSAAELVHPWETSRVSDGKLLVNKLFASLRNASAYQRAIQKPSLRYFPDSLLVLESDMLKTVEQFKSLSDNDIHFGKTLVMDGIKCMEQLTAQINDPERFGISEDSIEGALLQMVESATDMDHCQRGFAGRYQSPLLALRPLDDDPVQQKLAAHLDQLIEKAWVRGMLYANYPDESAMYQPWRKELEELTGRQPKSSDRAYLSRNPVTYRVLGNESEMDVKKAMSNHIIASLDPNTVYNIAREAISEEFSLHNNDQGDDRIYELFRTLGFRPAPHIMAGMRAEIELEDASGMDIDGDEKPATLSQIEKRAVERWLDETYRIGGERANRWQYDLFKADLLPLRLATYLIDKGNLTPDMDLNEVGGIKEHFSGEKNERSLVLLAEHGKVSIVGYTPNLSTSAEIREQEQRIEQERQRAEQSQRQGQQARNSSSGD